ncbi:murein L,D-transpeptidase catalytic domain-containing protein [Epilithonimonas zeae]|uniref:murein L,D-transpeptidase catalytic domain-containing protein n=1 Tax=Epilithonimonas zeae TaxID=1416779 RepID=UPI000940D5A6|nr:murein L,D-transpeptidase catalytic domain family protein [Epilithonimonas zeae]
MKSFFCLFFSVLILACQKENLKKPISGSKDSLVISKPKIDSSKTNQKAKEALQFCKAKNFNTDFCILIDMSQHSGLKRFFIYDFKKDEITNEYLVGHGCGNSSWSADYTKENPSFSNEDNSHLSSLGKYKIGARGYSNWGVNIKYLMHGLEETNSNALKRIIVFHSWEMMSDDEVYPKGSPEGWGCPTVSNKAFKEIDPVLKNSKKPVLMWIYN